jgi:voltage-dependent calcium channel L type alpha-1D
MEVFYPWLTGSYHPRFENGILLVIFLNTISMIMQKEHELEPDAQFWDDLDYVFSTIFMIEMSLKWFGYGLVRRQNSTLSCFGCGQAAGGDTGTVMAKGGYFRDTWNWLDFVIVIEGSVSMVTSSSIESQEINLSMVRIIRTLRPLRAVTHLPELQVIVQAIINSVPYIIDTLVICSFFFLLFSIAAMEWWSGLFHNRCFIATLENVSSPIYNRSEIVEWCNNDSGECQRGILTLDEDVEYLCGYRECPSADHVCSEWSENPNGDITSFDNVFLAWLTIFQISTLEGWVEIMNFAQDVSHSLVWPFFIIVVIFGNFILINLLMAVIANQYGEAHDRAEEVAREDRHKHQDSKKARAKWKKCQKKMRQIEHAEEGKAKENYFTKVVQSSTFDGIMMALIMLNIVSMSVDHYDPVDGEPEALADVLHYIGVAFTVVFGLEMLVKIIGLGLCNYLSDSMNIVDAVIVTIAIVELILADVDAKGVMALRALRFVRLVKLARSMKSMRQLCSVLAKAWKSIFYAMMLLLLFILIFSVAGMQLFARKLCSVGVADGEVCSEEDVPRNNYDSFYWAFVSTFQVLAGENWPALQFNAIQNEGYAISVTYYVLWVLIGQFIVLNLFLAIVMAYFEDIDVMESELYDEWSLQPWKRQLLSDLWHHVDSDGDGKMNKIEFEVLEQELNDSLAKKALASGDAASFDADGVLRAARLELPFSMIDDDESGLIQFSEFESWYFDYSDPVRFEKHQEALERIVTQSCFQHFKSWLQGDCVDRRKNLLFIPNKGARSCCHQKCQSFVESKYFEAFILLVITLSSILLAMDSPTLDQDGGLHEFIKVVDVVFVVIFVLEAVLKMATYGFLLHKGAYLRDAWNVLDFVVVGASIVGNVTESKHSAAGRTFRLLRAMRPLRMVSHNAGIKIIVDSLAKSIVSLLNVGVVVIFAWLLFALIGVQYLKGTFYRCNDPAFPEGAYRYGDSVDGCTAEAPCCTSEYSFIDEHGGNATREWVRSDMNFDNVFEAMLALFVFATGEGWPDAMFEASDVVGINYNPKRNATAGNAMFFVLNVAVFQFFVMELFVGAIFENFMILKNEAKEKQLKFGMTERQSQWYRAQQLLQTVGVPKQIRAPIFSALVAPGERSFCVRAVNAVIGCAHHLITEPPVVYPGDSASLLALEGRPTGHYYGSIFQAIVYTSIVLNTIVMASSHYGQADWWTEAVDGVNAVFTVVFCCEAALKIVGSGATVYFKDWWNKFDFLVVRAAPASHNRHAFYAGTSQCLTGTCYGLPLHPTRWRREYRGPHPRAHADGRLTRGPDRVGDGRRHV